MAEFSATRILEDALEAYSEAKPRSQQAAIGPSAIYSCRRQVYHQIKGSLKTNLATNFLPSLMGNAIHSMVETAMGKEFSQDIFGDDFEKEIPVEYNGLLGHVDLYIHSKRAVVDWKTSTKSKLVGKRFPWPPVQYIAQVHVYGYLLKMVKGYEVETVKLVGIPRDGGLQDIVEWTEDYDEEKALAGIRWIDEQYLNAEAGLVPEPQKNVSFCRGYCPFFDESGEIGCPGLLKGGY